MLIQCYNLLPNNLTHESKAIKMVFLDEIANCSEATKQCESENNLFSITFERKIKTVHI